MSDYILVVDDEPDVRQLFKITLSLAGYRTEVAGDGLEAMAAISKESPGLVLLDLMMPRLDGFGVLDKLREQKPNGDMKVLVATAKTIEDDDKERLESWPVVGVLNKGELDLKKMVGQIKKLLSEKPAVVKVSTSNGKPASDASPDTAAKPKNSRTPVKEEAESKPPKTEKRPPEQD